MKRATTLTRLIAERQLSDRKPVTFNRKFVSSIMDFVAIESVEEIGMGASVTCFDVDSTDKFLLIGQAEGDVVLREIRDEVSGELADISTNHYFDSSVNRCQWFPTDNGLFCVTYLTSVGIVDTNTLKCTDRYQFGSCEVNYSDWNSINPYIIAVAGSSSSIRFVDIRSGDALQHITVSSVNGFPIHGVTRVKWSDLDAECLFAGDSDGYIHIYDIRCPRKSLQIAGADETTCQSVTCLTQTRDSMNLLTCHGAENKLTMWTFKDGRLTDSNINYDINVTRYNVHRLVSITSSLAGHVHCQIFETPDFIFSPTAHGPGAINIHRKWTGERVSCLSSATWNPYHVRYNCVTGIKGDNVVLYSGSRHNVCRWNLKLNKELGDHEKKAHRDAWSDDDD